jgi:hypothetical protein
MKNKKRFLLAGTVVGLAGLIGYIKTSGNSFFPFGEELGSSLGLACALFDPSYETGALTKTEERGVAKKPPIDLDIPSTIETATFAMG